MVCWKNQWVLFSWRPRRLPNENRCWVWSKATQDGSCRCVALPVNERACSSWWVRLNTGAWSTGVVLCNAKQLSRMSMRQSIVRATSHQPWKSQRSNLPPLLKTCMSFVNQWEQAVVHILHLFLLLLTLHLYVEKKWFKGWKEDKALVCWAMVDRGTRWFLWALLSPCLSWSLSCWQLVDREMPCCFCTACWLASSCDKHWWDRR